jgi:tripartite-type tricarboxylate transporter receptor subunit TctC
MSSDLYLFGSGVNMKLSICLCSILILVLFFSTEGVCLSPYYQGKTITFVQGRDPGGVGDLRNKVIFQFLQKYIPGHPTIVSEYMPGGGGRKAANHVYHNAKGDGLTIGASSPGILAAAVLGMSGVNFNPAKFIYLGSPFSENNNIFVTRKALGIKSLEKLREHAGLRVGGQSVGHVQFIRSRLFAWLLGLKEPRFVVGYAGAELDLALERGEIDSRASAVDKTTMSEEYKKMADFHAILEIPKGSRPVVFAALPEVGAFTRTQMERDVLAMSRTFWGTGTLIFLPPNTPEHLARIVRQAMRKSFEDREFHEAYKKLLGVEATPLMPEDQQRLVAELPRDPEVAKTFAAIADMGPLPPRR